MLYPPMSELLKHIPSRYLLVNVVARRAVRLPPRRRPTASPWRISRSLWPSGKWRTES